MKRISILFSILSLVTGIFLTQFLIRFVFFDASGLFVEDHLLKQVGSYRMDYIDLAVVAYALVSSAIPYLTQTKGVRAEIKLTLINGFTAGFWLGAQQTSIYELPIAVILFAGLVLINTYMILRLNFRR